MPEGARSVARPCAFGNPFIVDRGESIHVEISQHLSGGFVHTNRDAVYLFRWWLEATCEGRMLARRACIDLAGLDLACFCRLDEPCHADVLIEIANRPKPEARTP